MRTFIAIDLPTPDKKRIAAYCRQLWGNDRKVKWVAPQHYHLTLKFLGATDNAQIPDISRRLRQIATQTAPFYLQLGKVGYFYSRKLIRVIWLAVEGERERAQRLAEDINLALTQVGFADEVKSMHLTLGRVRQREVFAEQTMVANDTMEPPISFAVPSFSWYRSILTGSEPRYELLEKFVLAG